MLKKQKAHKERNIVFLLFTIPGFLLYSFFFITPVLMGGYYSLTDWNGISRKYNIIGIENYKKIFRTNQFIDSLTFTLKYTMSLT